MNSKEILSRIQKYSSENLYLCEIINEYFRKSISDFSKTDTGDVKSYTYLDLFRNGSHLRFVSLNVIFNFTVNVLTYYGLTFNAAALPGDIFVNNGIQGLIDFVSCIIMVYLLNVFGQCFKFRCFFL